MEVATLVELVGANISTIVVVVLVLVGIVNKQVLITARKLAKEDPAGKALKIVEKADINELAKVVDQISTEVMLQDARGDKATPEAKNRVYDSVESAVKKKRLED